jgi:hypothetical protein
MAIPPLLAHGLGDAGDLPVELPVVLFAAAGIVLLAAWAVDRRHGVGRAPAGRPDRPLPRLTAVADAPATRLVLRLLTGAALALTVVAATTGPAEASANPAPRTVFVLFWGLLIPVSLLLGPVWRAVNPLRALAAGFARISGDPGWESARPLPEGVGVWPAVAQLAVFIWVEVAAAESAGPVLALLLGIVLVQVLAANRYGPAWFERGDPFEVVSTFVSTVSPLARDDRGVLVLRAPRRNARTFPALPGAAALLGLVIATHVTDFVLDSPLWHTMRAPLGRGGQTGVDTATLVGVALLSVGAIHWITRRARFLLAAVVPVAAGYAIAEDAGVLLVEGQFAIIQWNDPFGQGWNLLGLAGRFVPAEPVPAISVVLFVVAALVLGHVGGARIAGALTAERVSPRAARAVQLPLRTFLVVSVVLALFLRLTVE